MHRVVIGERDRVEAPALRLDGDVPRRQAAVAGKAVDVKVGRENDVEDRGWRGARLGRRRPLPERDSGDRDEPRDRRAALIPSH